MDRLPRSQDAEDILAWSQPVASGLSTLPLLEDTISCDTWGGEHFIAQPPGYQSLALGAPDLWTPELVATDSLPLWHYPAPDNFPPPSTALDPTILAPPPSVPEPTVIRCYAHGCGGRRFSSLGNYRRHVKEQNGYSKKFPCRKCGKHFTRSTARNEHEKQHAIPPKPVSPTELLLQQDIIAGLIPPSSGEFLGTSFVCEQYQAPTSIFT